MSSTTKVNSEKMKVYETILSSPGMNENCKIVLQITRQQILLLSRLIETGLSGDKNFAEDEILKVFPAESLEAFKPIKDEMLKKGELTDFYEKLKAI